MNHAHRVIFVVLSVAATWGCSGRQAHQMVQTQAEQPQEVSGVDVLGMTLHGEIVEGEVINRSPRTVRELTLTVSFLSAQGSLLFRKNFQVVPGGDGQSLPTGAAKHFKYQVKVGNLPAGTTVRGVLASVLWAAGR